jgi:hypothetical protein
MPCTKRLWHTLANQHELVRFLSLTWLLIFPSSGFRSLLIDKVLQRKRCPFCVAPFPLLKCISFGQWQCPACESEFCIDVSDTNDAIF